jgi:hypothetical protein
MREPSSVDSGSSAGTAIAVLIVGLMAIGVVFGLLEGTLYMARDSANQRPLSTIPARAVLNADLSSAK